MKNFIELFKSSNPPSPSLEGLIPNCVMEVDNENLMRIPQEEEIWEAIQGLHPFKSPGPDGFPGIFFRSYWEIVGQQTSKFVQECFRTSIIRKEVNRTLLILIPKTMGASTFNQFRPISLCNFVYKIVSKIIATRMRKIIPKLVSPNQGAFMEGRWIAENTILAHELVHKVKNHKGRNGLMLLKVDMKKAYDRIEWGFVEEVLEAWGFSVKARKLVQSCLNSVEFNLLLNGNISGKVSLSRGLRQGDPLSPFIFILCSEVLTRLLEKDHRIQGIKVCRNAPAISHLLYADDLLIACRADKVNAKAVMDNFGLYCLWSGQAANMEKSHSYFSKNTRPEVKRMMREILGFK